MFPFLTSSKPVRYEIRRSVLSGSLAVFLCSHRWQRAVVPSGGDDAQQACTRRRRGRRRGPRCRRCRAPASSAVAKVRPSARSFTRSECAREVTRSGSSGGSALHPSTTGGACCLAVGSRAGRQSRSVIYRQSSRCCDSSICSVTTSPPLQTASCDAARGRTQCQTEMLTGQSSANPRAV